VARHRVQHLLWASPGGRRRRRPQDRPRHGHGGRGGVRSLRSPEKRRLCASCADPARPLHQVVLPVRAPGPGARTHRPQGPRPAQLKPWPPAAIGSRRSGARHGSRPRGDIIPFLVASAPMAVPVGGRPWPLPPPTANGPPRLTRAWHSGPHRRPDRSAARAPGPHRAKPGRRRPRARRLARRGDHDDG